MIVKRSVRQENITILNVNVHNNRGSNYVRKKKIDRTAKTNRLIHYRSWRFRFQHLTLKWTDAVEVSKDVAEVNITITHLYVTVTYKLVSLTTAEQTFIKTHQNM